MSYLKEYLNYREELWMKFQDLVRRGAKFPMLIDVTYASGINPEGLMKDTDGRSLFMAKELIADPNYSVRPEIGPKDIIIEFNYVKFVDTDDKIHHLEPDIIDLYWLCSVLDGADGIS